jgi:hypothetical protein
MHQQGRKSKTGTEAGKMTEYLIKDFKGHSIGYNYDENTDTYEIYGGSEQ